MKRRPNRVRDIAGQRFGKLVAVHVDGEDSTGKTKWLCVCDCGQEARATMLNLTSGNTKSCGCMKKRSRRANLAGRHFGLLTAYTPVDSLKWRCLCACGTWTVVRTIHLTRGHTQSCGCLARAPVDTPHLARKRVRNSTSSWARRVRSDARHRCDACGSTRQLHAHHIMPFAQFPFLILDPENGACLCASCHRDVHERIRSGVTPGDALADKLIETMERA